MACELEEICEICNDVVLMQDLVIRWHVYQFCPRCAQKECMICGLSEARFDKLSNIIEELRRQNSSIKRQLKVEKEKVRFLIKNYKDTHTPPPPRCTATPGTHE